MKLPRPRLFPGLYFPQGNGLKISSRFGPLQKSFFYSCSFLFFSLRFLGYCAAGLMGSRSFPSEQCSARTYAGSPLFRKLGLVFFVLVGGGGCWCFFLVFFLGWGGGGFFFLFSFFFFVVWVCLFSWGFLVFEQPAAICSAGALPLHGHERPGIFRHPATPFFFFLLM